MPHGWQVALAVLWMASSSMAGEVLRPEPEPSFPFPGGGLLGHDQWSELRPYVPSEIWDRREYFLPDPLRLAALEVTAEQAGGDCRGDPTAAARIVWQMAEAGAHPEQAIWSYSYWQRQPGPSPIPADERGFTVLTYRQDGTRGTSTDEDAIWIYLPSSPKETPRSRELSPLPPSYAWSCLGEADVLAPTHARLTQYLAGHTEYGDLAHETWELREAWILRFDPPDREQPYHHSVFYIDKTTFDPLYGFAYDRERRLQKVVLRSGERVNLKHLDRAYPIPRREP